MRRAKRRWTVPNAWLGMRVQFWRVIRVVRLSLGMRPLRCRCNCGYRCGGPGVCKLDVMDCLWEESGHFVKDCEHDFSGPYVEIDNGGSATCVRCTATAMHHDCMCGP